MFLCNCQNIDNNNKQVTKNKQSEMKKTPRLYGDMAKIYKNFDIFNLKGLEEVETIPKTPPYLLVDKNDSIIVLKIYFPRKYIETRTLVSKKKHFYETSSNIDIVYGDTIKSVVHRFYTKNYILEYDYTFNLTSKTPKFLNITKLTRNDKTLLHMRENFPKLPLPQLNLDSLERFALRITKEKIRMSAQKIEVDIFYKDKKESFILEETRIEDKIDFFLCGEGRNHFSYFWDIFMGCSVR